MAAFTSKATGNWNASGQTTWNEVGVPGNGDTVTIAINHTITIPDGVNVIIGTSGPTGTAAVTLTGTSGGQGKLIVGQTTGATLTLRGDLLLADTYTTDASRNNFTINAGSTVTFDASQATTPLSQIYVVGPTSANTPNNGVVINGTEALPVTVTSNTSGGNGRFSIRGNSTQTGKLTATWCNFSRLGDATNAWLESSLNNSGAGGGTISLTDCTLDYCGHENQSSGLKDGTVYSFVRVVRTNSLGTSCFRVVSDTVSTVAANRACTDCVFDVPVGNSTAMAGRTFTRCVFWQGHAISAHASIKYQFDTCFFRKFRDSGINPVATASNMGGDFTNCYYFNENTTTGNQKWWIPSTTYNCTFNRGHLQATHPTDNTGDFISVTGNPASLITVTAKYMTCSPVVGGTTDRPETLWSMAAPGGGGANYRLVSEHNTWPASVGPHMSVGESESNAPNTISTFKSNITPGLASPVGTAQYHIRDLNATGGNVQLTAAAGDVNYNCGYNLKSGSDGTGYEGNFAGTPGANDVNVDPGFVDITRTCEKWAVTLGGAETTAAVLTLLSADTTRIGDLITWVQGGWAPTNTALKGAAHDGGDIGAVAVIVPSGGRPGGFPTLGSPGPGMFGSTSSTYFGKR